MKDIVIRSLTRAQYDEHQITSSQVDLGDAEFELWYKVPKGFVADGAEAMLVAALLPAMRLGRSVRIDVPISPRLLNTLPTIQEIFHAWDPQLTKIPIHARPALRALEPGGEVGLFFSGGLDSFYSLLKRRDEITRLIFVPSFDVSIGDPGLRAKVSAAIQKIAVEFQKPVTFVETNVREFCCRYLSWNFCHGAALASVALLLSPPLRRVYIAASHPYASLVPWGSHPLLDPLWGTEINELVHDGCEATRVDKARRLSTCDIALSLLQVCWKWRETGYNCGECEKCLRTMINFRIAGVLSRSSAFDRPLDLRAISRMRVTDMNARSFVDENLQAAEGMGTDPALVKALRDCLDGRYHRGLWRIARASRGLVRRVSKLRQYSQRIRGSSL